jgi:hypothetical protein
MKVFVAVFFYFVNKRLINVKWFSVLYLCIKAKKINYVMLYECTDLLCTQLEVLKHYYPGYTLPEVQIWQILNKKY